MPRLFSPHPVQLNSVYDSKLPVSRAKMANITKLAMKAAKVLDSYPLCLQNIMLLSLPSLFPPSLLLFLLVTEE